MFFFLGIAYEINKEVGNCSMNRLGEREGGGGTTGISIVQDTLELTRLRTPNELFRIDNNLFYVGEVLTWIEKNNFKLKKITINLKIKILISISIFE